MVYVDNMYATPMGQYGRMKMSHMVADTRAELIGMAQAIGLNPRWIQDGHRHNHVHFDVSLAMRRKAVDAGAQELTMREMSRMLVEWRKAAL